MIQQNINTRPTSHIRLTVSQHTEDEYDKWLQAVVQASSLVKLIDGCANVADRSGKKKERKPKYPSLEEFEFGV